MDIMGLYKSNAWGQLSPTRAQRLQAALDITANLRTRLLGLKGSTQAAEAAKSAVSAAAGAKAASSKAQTTTSGSEISSDMFLRLLMEQIRNQDPLEPMNNDDMLAQLAQFSALEQMNNLNDSFGGLEYQMDFLNGNIDQLNFISAQGLIGRYVEGVNAAGDSIKGTVESVTLQGSIVVLTVDGEILPMTGVMNVAESAPPVVETEEDL